MNKPRLITENLINEILKKKKNINSKIYDKQFIYNFFNEYCHYIILIIIFILLLSYRYKFYKNTLKKNDDIHDLYIKYKEYKRLKRFQKKLNKLEEESEKKNDFDNNHDYLNETINLNTISNVGLDTRTNNLTQKINIPPNGFQYNPNDF